VSGGGRLSLLHQLERIIERTYDLETGIRDISPFIIGDEGYTRLYDGREVARRIGSGCRSPSGPGHRAPARLDHPLAAEGHGAAPCIAAESLRAAAGDPVGARTLLREEGGGLKICLYYPDRLIDNLERHDPARSLSERNVDDFATLVEELDHLLTIADRHRAGAEISLLELELHANVTKELVMRLFVARMSGKSRLQEDESSWSRHHLFDKIEFREDDPEVQARYRDAASLSVRYLDSLHSLPAADRPRELRRFHRRTHHEKLADIARL